MSTETPEFCKDHYRAVKLLGKGAEGRVYKLEKKPEFHDTGGPDVLAKKVCFDAEKEADLMKSMPPHENVLRCYDYTMGDDMVEIYLEYCDEDLKSHMVKNRSAISKDPEKILTLSKQLMAGLAHIHEHKVFHRDLKPANVLVKHTDEGIVLKIADFGLSKTLKIDHTQPLTIAGTGLYMSPEMLEAFANHQLEQAEISPKPSDVFSVGLIMLQLLTPNIISFREDRSKTCSLIQERFPNSPIMPVLLLMLAENPRDRATAIEIHDYLDKALVLCYYFLLLIYQISDYLQL